MCLERVGDRVRALDRYGEAEAAYGESLDLHRALRERLGDNLQTIRDLAISPGRLAAALHARERSDEARPYDTEAFALYQRLHRAFPDNPELPQEAARIESRLSGADAPPSDPPSNPEG
jgi:hypothetical protein